MEYLIDDRAHTSKLFSNNSEVPKQELVFHKYKITTLKMDKTMNNKHKLFLR